MYLLEKEYKRKIFIDYNKIVGQFHEAFDAN